MDLDCNLEVVSFWFHPNSIDLTSGVSECKEVHGPVRYDFSSGYEGWNGYIRLIASCGVYIEEDYKTEDICFTDFFF